MVIDNNSVSSSLTTAYTDELPTNSLHKQQCKPILYCTHCHRTGHDYGRCFLVHGLPEWWLNKYGRSAASPSETGAADPTALPPNVLPATAPSAAATLPLRYCSTAAVITRVVEDIHRQSVATPASHRQPVASTATVAPSLPTQAAAAIVLLTSAAPTSLSWIIDTGASHHVTGDEYSLQDVQSIIPYPVGLPDGAKALATKEGRVVLEDGITLENVLFVPQLNCNLISVSKLIDDSNCFVRFTNSLCVVLDQSSGSLIGGGEWIDGLYYFRRLPKVCALPGPEISTFELWHRRLGHPSEKLSNCFLLFEVLLTRASSDSDSCASRILEMIHCDLWGPSNTTSTCGAHYFLTIVNDFSRGVWLYLLNDKTEVLFALSLLWKCVFVGYPHGKKGWKFYDLETGDIFVSRDVKFHENEFPFVKDGDSVSSTVGVESVPNDYVGVDHNFLDDLEYVFEVGEAVDTVVEPGNFKEAMQDEGWKAAMQTKIDALEKNGTW
ncbi:uncharacterized protein LOC110699281 [Chenopodium quinoa]|uniref:uncharacterized protein LOC110699281 n=1 Tax=Chenopodium quinoa TaxID=63459 RepID=UPI000B77F544|nr:uncharacterized protein LOC110699281 [Chenopodium quinoa]